MCLKGGPRCYGHALAAVEKAEDKSASAAFQTEILKEEYNDANRAMYAYNGKDQSVKDGLTKARNDTYRDYGDSVEISNELDASRVRLQKEADATVKGMEVLVEQRDNARNAQTFRQYHQRLLNAQRKYSIDLENHDRREGTVNGRKPSLYGTQEGLDELSNRRKKNEHKLAALHKQGLTEGDNPELSRKIKQGNDFHQRIIKQQSHAHQTFTHRNQGIIS